MSAFFAPPFAAAGLNLSVCPTPEFGYFCRLIAAAVARKPVFTGAADNFFVQ
jgi:hypothetical protein